MFKEGDKVRVRHVPQAYDWLQHYVSWDGEVIGLPTRHGVEVEFDDGDVEIFNDSELTLVEEKGESDG